MLLLNSVVCWLWTVFVPRSQHQAMRDVRARVVAILAAKLGWQRRYVSGESSFRIRNSHFLHSALTTPPIYLLGFFVTYAKARSFSCDDCTASPCEEFRRYNFCAKKIILNANSLIRESWSDQRCRGGPVLSAKRAAEQSDTKATVSYRTSKSSKEPTFFWQHKARESF